MFKIFSIIISVISIPLSKLAINSFFLIRSIYLLHEIKTKNIIEKVLKFEFFPKKLIPLIIDEIIVKEKNYLISNIVLLDKIKKDYKRAPSNP